MAEGLQVTPKLNYTLSYPVLQMMAANWGMTATTYYSGMAENVKPADDAPFVRRSMGGCFQTWLRYGTFHLPCSGLMKDLK